MADTSALTRQVPAVRGMEPEERHKIEERIETSKRQWAHLREPGSIAMADTSALTRQVSAVRGMEPEERSSIEERIENSKRHWTHLREPGSISAEEVEETDEEVFKRLQGNLDWGTFFHIFRDSELVVAEEKFAAGGQADIYAAQIRWHNSTPSQKELDDPWKWVVKVFKREGVQSPLRDLQKQWPKGMLQFQKERCHAGLSRRYNCDVVCGTLLKDGSFAFLMQRETEDLRTLIDRNMKGTVWSMWKRLGRCGPFSTKVAASLMYEIACGMEWLHDHDIVHRDLKAANVLVRQDGDQTYCFVADYECSVGTVGTNFFRAPEILQAAKDKSVNKKPDIFSKEVDIYSYGMTCYEILTGKLPFEGEESYNFDVVLKYRHALHQLQVPNYVNNWMWELLTSCWEYDPKDRPTFKMIKEQILKNSKASQGNEDIANSRYYWSQLMMTIRMSMLSEADEFWSTSEDNVEYFWSTVEEVLEFSEYAWRILSSQLDEEDLVEIDDREVFKALQLNPTWGGFFCTFGYDTEIYERAGELTLGAAIGEGGQANIFGAHITWANQEINEYDMKNNRQWVLKVYDMGTPLHYLQSEWPAGMLRFQGERLERMELAKNLGATFEWEKPINVCDVVCGTLLEDGRFAHLLEREQGDLRELIEFNMRLRSGYDCGPFSKAVAEEIMHGVALGMDWLHSHDIVHRDVKAANVLITEDRHGKYQCFVCDYECSIGVVGTRFWMAPEILQALKNKNVFRRPGLLSRAADVYSYAMTCYEILTGKNPFEGRAPRDAVINGLRPELPEYVDDWTRELLSKCWDSDPAARPSFGEILELFEERKKASESSRT